MATMNIAGNTPVNDPAYRYKMPRLMGKVEGRGNGIKTVLLNVKDVADALKREAPEVTKFFGCELGAQTTYAADTDRAVVNGAHRDSDLQTLLCKYIENFVLCASCRLPETHYKFKEGVISQKCLACGHKAVCDMTNKLTTFILAQHKKAKESAKGDKKKEEKDKKAAKKAAKECGEKPDKEETVEKEKEKKDKKEKKEKKEKKTVAVEESADPGKNVFGISAQDDEESDSKAAEDGMLRFKAFLESNPTATIQQQLDELRNIQTMASLRPSDRVIIYLGAVFGEDAIVKNAVETHRDLLAALAPSEIQQRHLIAGFEWFCGTRFSNLTKIFAKALLQLYEAELVEEDAFFAWAGDTTRNEFSAEESMMSYDTLEALRANANPFITWLAEAEEEEEDGEEDDEEEEEDDSVEDDDA